MVTINGVIEFVVTVAGIGVGLLGLVDDSIGASDSFRKCLHTHVYVILCLLRICNLLVSLLAWSFSTSLVNYWASSLLIFASLSATTSASFTTKKRSFSFFGLAKLVFVEVAFEVFFPLLVHS